MKIGDAVLYVEQKTKGYQPRRLAALVVGVYTDDGSAFDFWSDASAVPAKVGLVFVAPDAVDVVGISSTHATRRLIGVRFFSDEPSAIAAQTVNADTVNDYAIPA